MHVKSKAVSIATCGNPGQYKRVLEYLSRFEYPFVLLRLSWVTQCARIRF